MFFEIFSSSFLKHPSNIVYNEINVQKVEYIGMNENLFCVLVFFCTKVVVVYYLLLCVVSSCVVECTKGRAACIVSDD